MRAVGRPALPLGLACSSPGLGSTSDARGPSTTGGRGRQRWSHQRARPEAQVALQRGILHPLTRGGARERLRRELRTPPLGRGRPLWASKGLNSVQRLQGTADNMQAVGDGNQTSPAGDGKGSGEKPRGGELCARAPQHFPALARRGRAASASSPGQHLPKARGSPPRQRRRPGSSPSTTPAPFFLPQKETMGASDSVRTGTARRSRVPDSDRCIAAVSWAGLTVTQG